MSNKPLEVSHASDRNSLAEDISRMWDKFQQQRVDKLAEWRELRNYVFATDTTTTTNSSLPWKNSTTLPKLCQIRDNLHSNYLSALFPNDQWLKWEAYSAADASKEKVDAIEAYMSNKARMGGYRTIMSQLLYDYIDYGNSFVTGYYSDEYREDAAGERVPVFIGPKAKRISPLDIVFNPLAASFKESPKIIRSIKTISELASLAEDDPDQGYLRDALRHRQDLKARMTTSMMEDMEKQEGYEIDGFGSFSEYLDSGYIEILEFYGDLYDMKTDTLHKGVVITIADRTFVLRNQPLKDWGGYAPIHHVGWRLRPDNLWAMGPLDNLVGMQYRIDHLENLKADAMDLAVFPPIVIAGEVEEFEYAPGAEIHIDEGGTVTELARNAQWVIQSDNEIALLEQRMEMYAGAPREAMGIRSPGEKTMFEVQQLQNAAGRIFQEKITSFEIHIVEENLNHMLELAKRNLDTTDTVRVIDNDLGIEVFTEITKDDITASGTLRPIGARHFAAQAQMMQNLSGIFSSPVGQLIAPHTSSKKLALLIENVLGVERHGLFSPNIAVFERQETQQLMNQASEDMEVEAGMEPLE